jgi:branched-chain amino acid transport system substrate-binding protein
MKNWMHRLTGAVAAAVLIAGMSASVPARAADPYTIDVILSLTGAFAFLGTAEGESLKTLETLINKEGGIKGQPVHFNLLDDQTSPAVAVQLANGIIAKHPPVMLGPTFLASCLAIAPLMRNGPVDYCFAPTIHPAPGSYVFSGGASSYD